MRRYKLDPRRVRESVLSQCVMHWRQRTYWLKANVESLRQYNLDPNPKRWLAKPDPTWVGPVHDACVEKERTHYANVYIVEDGGFTLRYEEGATNGTGPFGSLQEAENWFYRGGR